MSPGRAVKTRASAIAGARSVKGLNPHPAEHAIERNGLADFETAQAKRAIDAHAAPEVPEHAVHQAEDHGLQKTTTPIATSTTSTVSPRARFTTIESLIQFKSSGSTETMF